MKVTSVIYPHSSPAPSRHVVLYSVFVFVRGEDVYGVCIALSIKQPATCMTVYQRSFSNETLISLILCSSLQSSIFCCHFTANVVFGSVGCRSGRGSYTLLFHLILHFSSFHKHARLNNHEDEIRLSIFHIQTCVTIIALLFNSYCYRSSI